MYRDVEAAEEGGVDLKAKFEWKREQGRLCRRNVGVGGLGGRLGFMGD